MGIVRARKVREIIEDHLSLAAAEEFSRVYNTLPGNGVAVILPPGAVRRVCGVQFKKKVEHHPRGMTPRTGQRRREEWKPQSGATGKEPS